MINDFLNYCAKSYSRKSKCFDCTNECPNTGNCEKCLENVHFRKTDRGYDCNNILFFYCCKYTYKYASEIWYLLVKYSNIRRLDKYKILSLGCGSCPDLVGLAALLEVAKSKKELTYFGVDYNKKWKTIHNWIGTKLNHPFKIEYQDVYDFLKKPKELMENDLPNIVIISYLISELLNAKCDINNFINLLIENILDILPKDSYIIINDFNRGVSEDDPRSYYGAINDKAKTIPNVNVYSYHFAHEFKQYYRFYNQHSNNSILFTSNPNINRFNPWLFCSSAQLIIEKL